MARHPQAVYRCPHCQSIKAQSHHLGGECPSCFQSLPEDLQPAYLITNPHPFRRAKARSASRVPQGMGLPNQLLVGLVLALCVVPSFVPDQLQAPEFQELSSQMQAGDDRLH